MRHVLYNEDQPVASFNYEQSTITAYESLVDALLPMQIRKTSADGFTLWLQERAIDLNTFQHRQLASTLLGSRDKLAVAMMTHMFSISDTFTCFPEGEFIPRQSLCHAEDQETVSDFILVSSDTALRLNRTVTPNASTDGSFPKTWKYEDGEWWLYKLQTTEATRSECEISRVLLQCGWDAAEYRYVGNYRTRIRSRNFVGEHEFFEPYDSLRFYFADRSDDERVIAQNIASLGIDFAKAFRRILLADALFMNTDRHMRNFGVIRSSDTGDILRLAPNFDNNQAYRANPSGRYSDAMLQDYKRVFGFDGQAREELRTLVDACSQSKYLEACAAIGNQFLSEQK